MTNLNKLIIKALILLTALFVTSIILGQNKTIETKNSIIIDGITIYKDSQSFNNLFEAKYKPNKPAINLIGLQHAFKVAKIYKNVTYIQVINVSYFDAKNILKRIKQANKLHNIKFIR